MSQNRKVLLTDQKRKVNISPRLLMFVLNWSSATQPSCRDSPQDRLLGREFVKVRHMLLILAGIPVVAGATSGCRADVCRSVIL